MPETFMGTPTDIQWKRKYENQRYNSTIHTFNMSVEKENGMIDEGIFTTTKEDQTKFKVGEKVQIKTSAVTEDHELVTKFDKVSERDAGFGGATEWVRREGKKDKAILANVALYCTFEFIVNNEQAEAVKADMSGLFTLADKIFLHLVEGSKSGVQTSINLQACVKRVAEYLHLFPNIPSNTSTEALKACDRLHDWITKQMNG